MPDRDTGTDTDEGGELPGDTPGVDVPEDAVGEDAGTEAMDAIEDAGDEESVVTCEGSWLEPGDYTLMLTHDGRDRDYNVHVPAGYDGTVPVPVVLNFHGYGSDAWQQEWYTGMSDKADEEGFVAVHPEGLGIPQSWNGGGCCGYADENNVDDAGFARAVVEELDGLVCIDRSRIYAAGMSNGGFLTHRLACEAADVFAAFGPVSSGLLLDPSECNPSRPVPLLHFHGTADLLVPYEGSTIVGNPPVLEMMAAWAARNGCLGTSVEVFREGDVHCETWPDCDAGVEVTLCTVDGGGHAWPGSFHGTQDVDATDMLWDFFSRFSIP